MNNQTTLNIITDDASCCARQSEADISKRVTELRDGLCGIYGISADSAIDEPILRALARAEFEMHAAQSVSDFKLACSIYATLYSCLMRSLTARNKRRAVQEGAQPGVRRKPARPGVPTVAAAPQSTRENTWVGEIVGRYQ